MVAKLAMEGVHISPPYLSQLRNGARVRPSDVVIAALAGFFQVRPVYLEGTYGPDDLGYLEQLDADLTWLELVHDENVRKLTMLVQGVPPDRASEMASYLDELAGGSG